MASIIGQGPKPEVAAAVQAQLQAQADLVLMFTQRAFDAMGDQFGAKSRTDEELVQLCRKAWKIGILMMKAAPFGARGADDDETGSGAEPGPGDGDSGPRAA